MKTCSKCKQEKPISEFAFKSRLKGTYQAECHLCRKQTAKDWYNKNKSSVVKAVQRRHKEKVKTFNVFKGNLGCALCDETEPACLDFHHLDPHQKDLEVAALLARGSKLRLQEEIKKCVCVCANCHRKIHAGLISLISL